MSVLREKLPSFGGQSITSTPPLKWPRSLSCMTFSPKFVSKRSAWKAPQRPLAQSTTAHERPMAHTTHTSQRRTPARGFVEQKIAICLVRGSRSSFGFFLGERGSIFVPLLNNIIRYHSTLLVAIKRNFAWPVIAQVGEWSLNNVGAILPSK